MVRDIHRRGPFLLGNHVRGAAVQLLSPGRDHVVVDRLPGERMPEAVPAVHLRLLLHELLLDRGMERRLHALLVLPRERDQRLVAAGGPEDGRRLQDLRLLRGESLDAKQDGVLDRLRQPQLSEGLSFPLGRASIDIAPVERRLQQFLEHERVALRSAVQEVAELGGDLVVIEDRAHHARHAIRWQRFELDHLGRPGAAPTLDHRGERVLPV